MSLKAHESSQYYLVPFGREPGGYLDLLGLPPDASESQAGRRDCEFLKEIDAAFRLKYREAAKSQKAGRITQEEFDAQVKVLEDQKNRQLTELSDLRSKFDLIQSERRRLANEGRTDDSVDWLELYRWCSDSPEEGWRFLLARRAPGAVDPRMLAEVERRWITSGAPFLVVPPSGVGCRPLELAAQWATLPESNAGVRTSQFRRDVERQTKEQRQLIRARVAKGELTPEQGEADEKYADEVAQRDSSLLDGFMQEARAAALGPQPRPGPARQPPQEFKHLPSGQVPSSGPVGLASVANLITERDLIPLLAADALWGELRFTNRDYWCARIEDWAKEVARLGPSLGPRAGVPERPALKPEFPVLCRPVGRALGRLEAEELGDLAQQPDRTRHQGPDAELADLLASLLGKGGGSAGRGRRPQSLAELLAALERRAKPPEP
jgi:hypothetical protein